MVDTSGEIVFLTSMVLIIVLQQEVMVMEGHKEIHKVVSNIMIMVVASVDLVMLQAINQVKVKTRAPTSSACTCGAVAASWTKGRYSAFELGFNTWEQSAR